MKLKAYAIAAKAHITANKGKYITGAILGMGALAAGLTVAKDYEKGEHLENAYNELLESAGILSDIIDNQAAYIEELEG